MRIKTMMLMTLFVTSLFTTIFTISEFSKDNNESEQTTRIFTENSQFVDWSKKNTPYEVFENIFIGEILSIEGTYNKNEDDVLSNRDIPITHYKVKVHKSLRGEFAEIIDVYFYGGYENEEELVLYDYSLELPNVGDTMIFFCSQPSDSMISVDSRLFKGVYQNWGRPGTLILLESYNPNKPLNYQNLIVREKVSEVIENLEILSDSDN